MTTSTVAAVVHELGAPFTLEDVELDEPRAHEVLVRMVATGLCHTDLSVRAGNIPFPLAGRSSATRAPASWRRSARPCARRRRRPRAGLVQLLRPLPGVHARPPRLLPELPRAQPLRRHARRRQPHHAPGRRAAERALLRPVVARAARARGRAQPGEGGRGRAARGAGAAGLRHPDRRRRRAERAAPGAGQPRSWCSAPAPWARPPSWRPRCIGVARIVAVDVVPARLALARELGATDVVDASAETPSRRSR